MYSFHFGPRDGKLYGAYSPPASGAPGKEAVVLCYPFGQEQSRAHMAFRQLANLIARRGLGVLRFDYFGTGDSQGELEDARCPLWIENVRSAMDELKALSGANQLSIVGLRLGALVGAYAAEGRDDVRRIVLWDPVFDGVSFLKEMDGLKDVEVSGSWWVQGFPLSPEFRRSLDGLSLGAIQLPDQSHLIQVQSHEGRGFDEAWAPIESHPAGARREVVPGPGDWNYEDEVGGILLPHELVRKISEWVAG